MSQYKAYLGDSVYVDVDEWGSLILTTENGYPDDPRNRIVLEPNVLAALEGWLEKMRKAPPMQDELR